MPVGPRDRRATRRATNYRFSSLDRWASSTARRFRCASANERRSVDERSEVDHGGARHVHHQDVAAAPDVPARHGRHAGAAAARRDGAGADGARRRRPRSPAQRFGVRLRAARRRSWTSGRRRPTGAGFEFTPILKPLEPFRDQLRRRQQPGTRRRRPAATHARQPPAWLSGVVRRSGPKAADVHAGIDRSIRSSPSRSARTRRSRRSSSRPRTSPGCVGALRHRLQLRLHEHALVADADDAAADGDQPARRVRAAVRPAGHARRSALARMQRGPQHPRLGHRRRRATCSAGSAPRDRARLDEYLDNVREIERRIQRDRAAGRDRARRCPTRRSACPTSFEEHVGADVRPAGARVSGRPHARLHVHDGARGRASAPIRRSASPSRITRSRTTATTRRRSRSTRRSTPTTSSCSRKFLEKLQSTPDGDGSLLDHSLILYGSGMSNGNVHTPYPLPHAGRRRRRRPDQGQPPHRRAGAVADRQSDAGDRGQVRRSRSTFGVSTGTVSTL